jgi:hypothetical protein
MDNLTPHQQMRVEQEQKVGGEVVRQATDNSLMNTEPAAVAGAVVGIVGAVGSILVIGGYADTGQIDVLKNEAGIIVPACFIIAGTVQAIWTRMKAYSPRSAARIAVANAAATAGSVPALDPPP